MADTKPSAKTVTGGTLLERRLAEVARKLTTARAVKVGFLPNAVYDDGTPVALIAAIQDFGTWRDGQKQKPVIPPRPFFRNAVKQNQRLWPGMIKQLLPAQDYDAAKVLTIMGAEIKGEIQQSIRDTMEPPLKPATVAAKGFDKPLIDTAHMINSVDFEVETS